MTAQFNILSIDFVHVTNCFYDYDYYDYETAIHTTKQYSIITQENYDFGISANKIKLAT